MLADLGLKFQPGSSWNFGLSTDICARPVDILFGRSIDRYLRANLFGPLRMVDTGFPVPDGSIDRFATCYRYQPGGESSSRGGESNPRLSRDRT